MARPQPGEQDLSPLAVGESRRVELYAIRLDVVDFTEEVDRERILRLPVGVRENLWLYDLDITGESGKPRLLDNAMAQIRTFTPDHPNLSQAERNMVRLLTMTPDTADLSGTSLAKLLEIAPKVGFSAAEVLADAVGIGVEESLLGDRVVTTAVVDTIINSHPNARWRPGKKSASNPSGLVAVPWGHIPITLEDAASNMASLSRRFGPYQADGIYHPGFVVRASAEMMADDFQMVIKANANALPFKGVDLTSASRGNISSIGNDSGALFDFSDPDWLRIEGLRENVVVDEKVFQILEHPEEAAGSTSPLPAPLGNSPVWALPRWTVEHLIAHAGYLMYGEHQYYREYALGDPDNPLFLVEIENGWMTITTLGDLGSPPPPLYIWDLFLEVAQARLHDGPDPSQPQLNRIPEGEAHVRFALTDVEVGINSDQITAAIRRNLEEDPSGLIATASVLFDQSAGVPDFYYFRPRADGTPESQADWLLYIVAEDLPLDEDGEPVRDYALYQRPGFFADADLSVEISATTPVSGDIKHRKIQISPGDVFFAGDDTDAVFQIEVLEKPSRAKVALEMTRVH